MSRLAVPRRPVLFAVLAVALAALALPAAAFGAVQFDLSPHYTHDVVVNTGDTQQSPADNAFSEPGTAFATQARVAASPGCSFNPNALPNDGLFAASGGRPAVQLGFADNNNGLNAWKSTTDGAGFTLDVPDRQYGAIHLFASSTEGSSVMSVTLTYATGSPSTVETPYVSDWFNNPSFGTYALIDGMDRMRPDGSQCFNVNTTAIFGVPVDVDESRTLQSVRVTRLGYYGSHLVFFGALGLTTPTVATAAASDVSPVSATLNGTVNPNGLASTSRFEYGTTTGYGQTTAETTAGSGSADAAISAPLTGLQPFTTYHFRAVATNADGTSRGADQTFTTGAIAPEATTSAATAVGQTGATVNGSVDPNGAPTTYRFDYGTTEDYGTSTTSQSAGAGSTAATVAATLSGLTPGTTYHVRLVATNAAGSTSGGDRTFTTAPPPPTVATGAASDTTSSSATLGGTVNANGAATTYRFEYGTSTSYGSRVPASDADAGSGSAALSVTQAATGLAPNTTYHFRLVATSASGTSEGADQTFTTNGAAPGATTEGVSAVTASGATLNGTVDPQNSATSYRFEYGTTTDYGARVPAVDESAGADDVDHAVAQALTGLAPNTTYHVRLVATNASGTTTGGDRTFTTQAVAPVTTTGAATAVTPTGAALNATVNARNSATTYRFEYGTTTSYGSRAPAPDASAGAGGTDRAVAQTVTGLAPNTTYHFRVVATNAAGTTEGADQVFSTNAFAPAVLTKAASAVGQTAATVNGDVTANGVATTYHFDYGPTSAYGSSTPDQSAGQGSASRAVSAALTGLAAGTTYHVRLVATSAAGTTSGGDQTFTTTAKPAPAAATSTASAGTPSAGAAPTRSTRLAPPWINDLRVNRRCVRSVTLTALTPGTAGLSFGFALTEDATVRYEIRRRNDSPRWSACPRRAGDTAGGYTGISRDENTEKAGRHDTSVATAAAAGPRGRLRLRAGRRHVTLARAAAGQKLTPGTYVLHMTATNASGRSAIASVKFWVVG